GDIEDPPILVVCNLTPVVRRAYRLGAPNRGTWRERLNSDALIYGGSGSGNFGQAETTPVAMHGRSDSLELTLPALSVLFLSQEPSDTTSAEAGVLATVTEGEVDRETVSARRQRNPEDAR
ncbi:MAG: alpha amylase C-terminal domain-containing protein, partial [Thermoanaerobaculia bacterium]|nr:alpha amylase C-terminal domain-containing protein [Thermoanaerobaculia bacterium]